jgi:hypothetical protein
MATLFATESGPISAGLTAITPGRRVVRSTSSLKYCWLAAGEYP